MYEVLSRRFRRAREGGEDVGTWKLPDLIVVDGGKGQLAMALAAARDVGIDVRAGVGLPIVALAKERDVALEEGLAVGAAEPPAPTAEVVEAAASPEPVPEPAPPPPVPTKKGGRDADGATRPDRVFLPHAKDAIPIRTNSAEMFVLQQLRDEAHRFAISFHRNRRRRLTLRSALSEIPGIGPGRQRQLLRHFGSIKRVREATADELAEAPGISRAIAEAVHAYWARQPLDANVTELQATLEQAAAEEPHAEEQAIEAAFSDDHPGAT